jgi:hypothetical protein
MVKIIKISILFVVVNLCTLSEAQINVRFGDDCLLTNSMKFGRAIMETIGEKSTRKLINSGERAKIIVEVDSLGRVSKILSCNFRVISKIESTKLLSYIRLKGQFFICCEGGSVYKDLAINELRNDFRRNNKPNIVLLFPGQLLWDYNVNYNGKATKANYIIKRLKEHKR